jgi:adenylate cyclase
MGSSFGVSRQNVWTSQDAAYLSPVPEPGNGGSKSLPDAPTRPFARRFDELRALCTNAETQVPLVMGMAGLLSGLAVHGRIREALQLTSEYMTVLESIREPTLTVGLLYPVIHTKYEAGEMIEVLTLSQHVIDLADGDPRKGNILTGSPLAFATAMRASARCALGQGNWKDDFDEAMKVSRVDLTTYVSIVMFKYVLGILTGALRADAAAMHDTAEALATAQRCSEDIALHMAQLSRGVALVSTNSTDQHQASNCLPQRDLLR